MAAGCNFGPPLLSPADEAPPVLTPIPEATLAELEFGEDGLVIIDDLVAPGQNEFGRAMALLPGGGLAVAAVISAGTEIDAAVLRLDRAGGLIGSAFYRTPGEDYLEALAVDPEGAIYAAGAAVFSVEQSVVPVVKYRSDGALDPAFGMAGQVFLPGLAEQCTSEDRAYQVAFGLALDRDMRLLLSGNATEVDCVNRDMIAARLDRMTGALDPSFGTTGVISTSAPGFTDARSDNGQDVIALPDGRIAVVGNTNLTGDFDTAEAVLWIRGEDGAEQAASVFQDLDGNGWGSDSFRSVTVDPQGRMVVAGRSFNGTDYDAIVVRFDATGALDRSFAEQGVYVSRSNADDRARRLAIDSSGRIMVVGYTLTSSGEEMIIWRLTPDGQPDSTWGTDGIQTQKWSKYQRGEAIVLDDAGHAFICGSLIEKDDTWALFVYRISL